MVSLHQLYLVFVFGLISGICHSQGYNNRLEAIESLPSIDDKIETLRDLIDGDTYSSYPDTTAMLLLDLSHVLFRNNVSIAKSIDALDEAQTHISLHTHKDLWLETWYYKGYWYRKWDKYDEAKDALQVVLDVTRDNLYEWKATIQLGKTFKDRGDFSLALDTYDKALRLAGDNKDRLATTYEVISFVYLIMDTEDGAMKAIPWLKKLISLLESMPDEEHFIASMTYNLGTAYLTLGDFKKAETMFSEAEVIIENCCDDDDFRSLLMESRASILFENGDLGKALELYLSALDLYQESFDLTRSDGLGSSYHQIANVYHAKGDLEMALEYIQKAISYRLAGIDPNGDYPDLSIERLRSNGEKHYLIEELLTLSSILYYQYEKSANDDYLKETIDILERCEMVVDFLRLEVIEESSKLFWRERTARVYDRLVELYIKIGKINKAFYATEKSKYLLTGEHLAIKSLPTSEMAELALIDEYNGVQQSIDELALLKGDFEILDDNSKVDSISHLLVDLKNDKDDILRVIKSQYPVFYQNNFSFHISSIQDVQHSLLSNNQSLVEYHITDELLFAFVINRDSAHVIKLGGREKIKELIFLQRELIVSTDRMKIESLDSLFEVSCSLYDCLIRPLESHLSDEIYIITDEELSNLSFSTLINDLSRENRKASLSSWPFMLYERSISYLYSASLEAKNHQETHKSKTVEYDIVAIRPSFTSFEDIAADDVTNVIREDHVELKGAAQEVSFLKKMTKGLYLENDDATEDNLKSIFKEPQHIVHIASHAILEKTNSALSRIMLHPSDTEDGTLHGYEISQLDIDVDLVVLSACNTGVGEVYEGEGVRSLGHAFTQAGGKNVVSSLWSMDDNTTADIIQLFYTSLFTGGDINNSLRTSQILFKKEAPEVYHHPFYWGGFMSIGQGYMRVIPAEDTLLLNAIPYVLLGAFLTLLFIKRNMILLNNRKFFQDFIGFRSHINIFRNYLR